MIVSEKIDANNSFQITLSPNNSLSWGGNLLFLFFVSFPILVIAITFAIAGAPIILPFAGLEILVVTIAIWYISKRNNRQEVIKLSFDKLIIEKGIKKPEIFKELYDSGLTYLSKDLHIVGTLCKLLSPQKEKRFQLANF